MEAMLWRFGGCLFGLLWLSAVTIGLELCTEGSSSGDNIQLGINTAKINGKESKCFCKLSVSQSGNLSVFAMENGEKKVIIQNCDASISIGGQQAVYCDGGRPRLPTGSPRDVSPGTTLWIVATSAANTTSGIKGALHFKPYKFDATLGITIQCYEPNENGVTTTPTPTTTTTTPTTTTTTTTTPTTTSSVSSTSSITTSRTPDSTTSESTSTSKPDTGSTSTSKPDTGSTSTSKPDTGSSSTSKPDTGSSSTSKPDTGSSSTSKPDTGSSSTSKPDTGSSSTSKPDTGSSSTSKPDTGSSSTSKPDTGSSSTSATAATNTTGGGGSVSSTASDYNTSRQTEKSPETDKYSFPVAAVAGGVAGGLLLILIIAIAITCKRNKKEKKSLLLEEVEQQTSTEQKTSPQRAYVNKSYEEPPFMVENTAYESYGAGSGMNDMVEDRRVSLPNSNAPTVHPESDASSSRSNTKEVPVGVVGPLGDMYAEVNKTTGQSSPGIGDGQEYPPSTDFMSTDLM